MSKPSLQTQPYPGFSFVVGGRMLNITALHFRLRIDVNIGPKTINMDHGNQSPLPQPKTQELVEAEFSKTVSSKHMGRSGRTQTYHARRKCMLFRRGRRCPGAWEFLNTTSSVQNWFRVASNHAKLRYRAGLLVELLGTRREDTHSPRTLPPGHQLLD